MNKIRHQLLPSAYSGDQIYLKKDLEMQSLMTTITYCRHVQNIGTKRRLWMLIYLIKLFDSNVETFLYYMNFVTVQSFTCWSCFFLLSICLCGVIVGLWRVSNMNKYRLQTILFEPGFSSTWEHLHKWETLYTFW